MKITVIGAGSHFNLALLRSIYQVAGDGEYELRMMDIRPEALDALARIIPEMNAASGKKIKALFFGNRQEALQGAAHVLVSFAVDFPYSFLRTCDVMHRHGLQFQEGETATPGALMATMRHLPPLLDIVRDIQTICPTAWLHVINNPLPRLLRGIIKATGFTRLAGHCHGTLEVIERLSILTDVPKGDIDVFVAGINHFHILQRATQISTGEDLLARLVDLSPQKKHDWAQMDKTQYYMFRDMGYFLGCGQWHNFDYIPTASPRLKPETFFTWDACCRTAAKDKNAGAEIGSHLKTQEDFRKFLVEPEREQMFKVMRALSGESEPYHFLSANNPNQGLIKGLPDEAIVELPATVSRDLIRMHQPPEELPRYFLTWLHQHIALSEMSVDVVLQKSKRLAVETVALDACMRDCDCAPALLLSEMIEVNAGLIPELD
ncbi:MAG: hypothetical protein SGI98_04710 [Verrucomicrobiota bacterium]|nr:hypothetical protein [Verrucomicrobiota bacterium]